jgi:glycosyltransferase involved in cell wall biosynthesis
LSKKSPFISIVTPSLNQAAYIEENIKSVLNQNYPHFEHIIIDGGSTDGTIDILKKYDHLIWVSEEDNGQSEAINRGFKRAMGEIIGWLNSDDCYEPDAFGTVAEELSRAKGKYVVFGDCYKMDEEGKRLAYYQAKLPCSKDWFKFWKKDYVIHSASTFFYKDILEEVGYLDQDLHYTMDDEYWLRIKRHYQFYHIGKPLARIRIHDRMKTISRGEMFEREWFMIIRKHWSKLPFIDRYYHLFMALTCRSNSIRMRAYSKIDELSSYEFRKAVLLSLMTNPLSLFKRKFVSALFRAIFGHRLSNQIKALYDRNYSGYKK